MKEGTKQWETMHMCSELSQLMEQLFSDSRLLGKTKVPYVLVEEADKPNVHTQDLTWWSIPCRLEVSEKDSG